MSGLAQTVDRVADAYEARPGYPTAVFDILSATFSSWIALSESLRTQLLDGVEELVRRVFAGTVTRPYKTVLYTAQRLLRTRRTDSGSAT